MRLLRDILRSYRAPREVMAERLAVGPREERTLALLFLACGLMFFAQWPRLVREAGERAPLEMLLSGALLGWLFIAPLGLYVLAALLCLLLRAVTGAGQWWAARAATVWALLASTPLWLAQGLVAGYAGPGLAADLLGLAALLALAGVLLGGLAAASRFGAPA